MIADILLAAATGILFGIGVFQVLRRDLIKAAMGFTLMFTAVNLFLLAVGAFAGEAAPFTDRVAAGEKTADPLVQALILTAVVVGLGSYSLLLGMVNVVSRRYETIDSDQVDHLNN